MIIGAGLCLLLNGCATHQPTAAQADSPRTWSGRMSVKTLTQPPQHNTASFILQGSALTGSLALLTPLGTTVARAAWGPGFARLERVVGTTSHYTHLDELMQAILGNALPMPALFSWLDGQEAVAQGWSVQLNQWRNGKLTAQRVDPEPGVEIRILLDSTSDLP